MTAISDARSNAPVVASMVMPLDALVNQLIPLADGPVETVEGFRAWREVVGRLLGAIETFSGAIPGVVSSRYTSIDGVDAIEARATLEGWASDYMNAAG